jgi:hypothetical protein
MDSVIDTSHPMWEEFSKIELNGWRPLDRDNWISYVKTFSKDQLEIFVAAFPNVTRYISPIIKNIICFAEPEARFAILDLVSEVLGCDFSKNENYDCIQICITVHICADDKISLLKYFLDRGAIFTRQHIRYASGLDFAILKFMMENGADPNDVVSSILGNHKLSHPILFDQLQYFIDAGVDLIGHIEQVNKK